jgi:hypothetical protein
MCGAAPPRAHAHIDRVVDAARPATDVAAGDRADTSGAKRYGPF